ILLPGMKPKEYAIINRDWRYIRYADGGEELYELRKDCNEWDNLAQRPEHRPLIESMKQKAPKTFAKPGPEVTALNLSIKGEAFHWKLKNPGKVKRN
ncbi:MAG: hypothetical protein RLZZ245_3613, partial [Verrucomicrobiota bacterium]